LEKGGTLCWEDSFSSILRLSVKNPTKPAFEKGKDEKCHTLGSFQRNLLLVCKYKKNLCSHSKSFGSSIFLSNNLLLFF
jgi:hypothetical protein